MPKKATLENGESVEVAQEEERLPVKWKPSEFGVARADQQAIKDAIYLNLGGKPVKDTDLARLKVPSGGNKFWTIPDPDGPVAVKEVDGIIIYWCDKRGWWPGTEPTGKPPQCRSDDALHGFGIRWQGDTMGPHECGPTKCKHADWGSDPKGGPGQACKETKPLFILLEKTAIPLLLRIPPTSTEEVRKFFINLVQFFDFTSGSISTSRRYDQIVTRFSLEEDKDPKGNVYNRVKLSKKRNLSEERGPNGEPSELEAIGAYCNEIRPFLEKISVTQVFEEDAEEEAATVGD